MSRFLKVSSFFLLVIVSLFLSVSEYPVAEAATAATDDCTATLMPDSTIHIPAIRMDGHTYSADMQYMPSTDGNVWFGIGNILAADGVRCSNPSMLSDVSGKFLLAMPLIAIGAEKYKAVLEYDPSKHATAEKTAQTIFRVDVEMRLKEAKQAESEQTFEPSMLPAQFELSNTLHIEVTDTFFVDMHVKGTVQLGEFQPNNQDGQMSFSYITGPANGTLDIITASCRYSDAHCTCVMKTVGSGGSPLTSGSITVNSLEISPIVSPWDVKLNYNIDVPDSSATIYARCCSDDGDCSERETPIGNAIVGYYQRLHQAEFKGGHFEATNFSHSFIFSKQYWFPDTFINEFLMYSGSTELTLWPGANLL